VVADDDATLNGHRSLDLVAASSTFWSDTLDVMGWDVDGTGLHVIFARDIPTIVHERVRPGLEEFLGRHELTLESLDHVVAHPGGTKVLAAYQEALGLKPEALGHARQVLRDHGNMSSPTILFILQELQRRGAQTPCVALAFGPGVTAEAALLGV